MAGIIINKSVLNLMTLMLRNKIYIFYLLIPFFQKLFEAPTYRLNFLKKLKAFWKNMEVKYSQLTTSWDQFIFKLHSGHKYLMLTFVVAVLTLAPAIKEWLEILGSTELLNQAQMVFWVAFHDEIHVLPQIVTLEGAVFQKTGQDWHQFRKMKLYMHGVEASLSWWNSIHLSYNGEDLHNHLGRTTE